MTIDPKDFKTLLVRLALVTLVLRAAPMFTADLAPGEAAAVLGLTGSGQSGEPWLLAARAWALAGGGVAGAARLPALVFELSLPILALGYARVAGWGSLAGLVVGLSLVLSPLAMQAGHRLGGGAAVAALVLLVLTLLRSSLKEGEKKPLFLSALGLVVLALLASPALVVVPAGLWLAWRAVADDQLKRLALWTWSAAPLLGLLARWAWLGYLVPETDAATAQFALADSAESSGWGAISPALAALQGLAAVSPLGPIGELGRLLDLMATPWWSTLGGAALLLAALYGLARGLVQQDPQAPLAAPELTPIRALGSTSPARQSADATAAEEGEDSDETGGAAARHGWRTLGVAIPNTPRTLGDRDWGPPLLIALGAALFLAQASARGVADGVAEALAAARVGVALTVGVGLAALATPRTAGQSEERSRRRTYWTLGAVALSLFGLGAWHLLEQTRSVERMSARKVGRFAKDSAEDPEVVGRRKGAILAVGPRGWAVAVQLDPHGQSAQIRLATAESGDVTAHALELLKAQPGGVVVVGDKAALGTEASAAPHLLGVMRSIDRTLRMHGLVEVSDSHRLLGQTAVIVYSSNRRSDPGTVQPQLAPGVAP